MLSRTYAFDPDRLGRAIAATFARRGTIVPEKTPDALTATFSANPMKQTQWKAFARDLAAAPLLDVVVADLAEFLMPHARSAIESKGTVGR